MMEFLWCMIVLFTLAVLWAYINDDGMPIEFTDEELRRMSGGE